MLRLLRVVVAVVLSGVGVVVVEMRVGCVVVRGRRCERQLSRSRRERGSCDKECSRQLCLSCESG